jgi:hypothetical protein
VQGINLPAGLQGVPEDFMKGMEDHAAGLVEDIEMPPVIEMPEPEPSPKAETPRAITPPESPKPAPAPVVQPDLMNLDTPKADSVRFGSLAMSCLIAQGVVCIPERRACSIDPDHAW